MKPNPWSNFCDAHWELICHKKWHPQASEISTSSEIAVGTHSHARHCTKTTPVFLPADGEASWLLLPSSVSLLSGATAQLENTYSRILKVTPIPVYIYIYIYTDNWRRHQDEIFFKIYVYIYIRFILDICFRF